MLLPFSLYKLVTKIHIAVVKVEVCSQYAIMLRHNFDSSVSLVTGYWLDEKGGGVDFYSWQGQEFSLLASRLVLGPTQPPIQWVPRAFSQGINWSGHEADYSPPTIVPGSR
jgi:hypothetical protein